MFKGFMSEPEIEIARRCTACGISVRQHAMFCPQCGTAIPEHQSATTNVSAAADTIIDNAAVESTPTPAPPVVVHRPADHSVKARMEHIRKVSSVMIDQAAYDPSIRFLLVAAGFSILFLVLLIASKVIG
jgi:predicted RNA-binding Zn-ribbon protein involved in translation (DUF1610 family)